MLTNGATRWLRDRDKTSPLFNHVRTQAEDPPNCRRHRSAPLLPSLSAGCCFTSCNFVLLSFLLLLGKVGKRPSRRIPYFLTAPNPEQSPASEPPESPFPHPFTVVPHGVQQRGWSSTLQQSGSPTLSDYRSGCCWPLLQDSEITIHPGALCHLQPIPVTKLSPGTWERSVITLGILIFYLLMATFYPSLSSFQKDYLHVQVLKTCWRWWTPEDYKYTYFSPRITELSFLSRWDVTSLQMTCEVQDADVCGQHALSNHNARNADLAPS